MAVCPREADAMVVGIASRGKLLGNVLSRLGTRRARLASLAPPVGPKGASLASGVDGIHPFSTVDGIPEA